MVTILNDFLVANDQRDLPAADVALTSKSVHSWPLESCERLRGGQGRRIQALACSITDARMGVLEHRRHEAVNTSSLDCIHVEKRMTYSTTLPSSSCIT